MRGPKRLPALVDAWFDLLPDNQRETSQHLHNAIMQAAPQADLLVRSGNLFYGVGHEHVLALAPHRTHVHLQVLSFAQPSPAFPELVPAGKGLMWRFKLGDPVDAARVSRLAGIIFSMLRVPGGAASPRG
jgi:hypothetical protein